MSAPKTKKRTGKPGTNKERKSIQLIVFAPINTDPEDEDNRIYMVCPPALKVIEVVEKYDQDAQDYITLLGKTKNKRTVSSKTFIEDLGKSVDVDGATLSGVDDDDVVNEPEIAVAPTNLPDELEQDVVTFASDSLDDIFPDEGDDSASRNASDVDLADALALLDEEDNFNPQEEFKDFQTDSDDLPELG